MPPPIGPEARPRLPALDHLRAFAVAAVFLYHYRPFAPPALAEASTFGWSGVDLFFVLSGYLLGSQIFARHAAGRPQPWSEFLARRAFRTLPAFFAVLAIYLAVPAFTERSVLPPWWKLALFAQNVAIRPDQLAFSHAWSLCVEEHFYLLLPLICALVLRPGRTRAGPWLLSGLFAAGPLLRAWIWLTAVAPVPTAGGAQRTAWYRLIYYPTWTRLDGLLVGVALAALVVFLPVATERLLRWGNALLVAGAGLLWASSRLCADQSTLAASALGFPLVSLGYGAILLSALSSSSALQRLPARATRFAAAASYSLYLTHKSIVHVTLVALGAGRGAGWGVFAACCATSLLAAAALHFAVERPFLQLRDRWLQRRSSAPAAELAL